MRINRIAVSFLILISNLIAVTSASAELVPMPDGQTVYDTHLSVRWLANANLAGTDEGRTIASSSGITTITPGGSMSFDTAMQWLGALNGVYGLRGGAGYLGHNDWTLPTMPLFPLLDNSCTSQKLNSFGYGCTGSDLGSLFNLKRSLGLQYPDTAVPIPDKTVGPFHNFQPYLYWSNTGDLDGSGWHTFSFSTGDAGSNIDKHYMYVLPMIKGNPFGTVANDNNLHASADGQTVYDPRMDITWLADADLARTQTFGAQCANYEPSDKPDFFPPGIPCIDADGAMTHETALHWIDGMNKYSGPSGVGWLGQTEWKLPADPALCGGFGCTDTPMGELYYIQLHLSQGTPVVTTPGIVGPFNHVQPYLYWNCGASNTRPPCQNPFNVVGFGGSFSLGNGFQGSDVTGNDLYVTVYFPQSPAQALIDAIQQTLSTNPAVTSFLSQADAIASASDATAKAGSLAAFINHVNTQRGQKLTSAQADELIALARAI